MKHSAPLAWQHSSSDGVRVSSRGHPEAAVEDTGLWAGGGGLSGAAVPVNDSELFLLLHNGTSQKPAPSLATSSRSEKVLAEAMASGSFRVNGNTSLLMQQKAMRRKRSAKLSPDPSREKVYWLSFMGKSLTGTLESLSMRRDMTFFCRLADFLTTNVPAGWFCSMCTASSCLRPSCSHTVWVCTSLSRTLRRRWSES